MTTAVALAIDRDRGFTVLSPEMCPDALKVVAAARGLSRRVDRLSDKAKAGFMVPLLDPATIDTTSPFQRLARHPDILDAVSSYLGRAPVLTHLQVYVSEAGSLAPHSSQLWHCDADATSQVKVFVLCSEVTAANGPLTLLDARTSRMIRRRLEYRFGGKLADKRVASLITPADHHPIVGPPGTVCLVDTTQCFHFGSRVALGAEPRVITMFQYLAAKD